MRALRLLLVVLVLAATAAVPIVVVAAQVSGTKADDNLKGTAGNDRMVGKGGDDRLRGKGGADDMAGGGGNDELFGQVGDDKLNGGAGDDDLSGGSGSDDLQGRGGNDTIDATGDSTGDFVKCGPGNDSALVDEADLVADSSCERVEVVGAPNPNPNPNPGGSASVTVRGQGNQFGSATSSPAGLNCSYNPLTNTSGGACTVNFPAGQPLTIQGSGAAFITFSGACVREGGSPPRTCTFSPPSGSSEVVVDFSG